MPRKTDSKNPADWLHLVSLDLEGISAPARGELACTMSFAQVYFTGRFPGFDLADPDWPVVRAQLADVERLFFQVKERVG